VVDQFRLQGKAAPVADLSEWDAVVEASTHPIDEVTIAVVGKYVDHKDAYKSVGEALKHGGIRQRTRVNLKWLEAEDVERDGADSVLAGVDGILVPGGFGDRGFEGKVLTSKHARETRLPYFGICYGMQAAVVDVARHVAGLEGANSTENDRATPHPVIGLITEWRTPGGRHRARSEGRPRRHHAPGLAGTTGEAGHAGPRAVRQGRGQRAPSPPLRVQQPLPHPTGSGRAGDLGQVDGRPAGGDGRTAAGRIRGSWPARRIPEFLSTPRDGHPLFVGFIRAARERKAGGKLLSEAAA
jgi:CTP synthase